MRFLAFFLLPLTLAAELTPEQTAQLPPAATRPVEFVADLQPLFEAACVKCHGKGKEKGGFSMENRAAFLKGGDTGPAAVPGKGAESYVVELVAAVHADEMMPKKGTRWTPEQVGLLRAWIDQGAQWPEGVTFAKPPTENLHPRAVALPGPPEQHPVDQLLGPYFAAKGIAPAEPVEDRLFARRVYLDLIGLLPSPAQLTAFLEDAAPDKRAKLVRALLSDRQNYADHWLTFWNDLLRNDYKGTGFIDGGRKQITGWLYTALANNLPYDQFVAQLVSPNERSEGFTRGIIWRGNVNASMLPPMQAAQNVSQVFLGINLKCASCHDSFVNDWSLSDAYGLAAIYADQPLELIHCDKPTGKMAASRFLYPEIGNLDAGSERAARLARLAAILTSREDGRLAKTIVNRLWARLLGRGLVEPLDDMEKPAWSSDVLDWLAEDFVAHGYDLKHTLEVICTARAYQFPSMAAPQEKEAFVFRGPLTRRLTAEQFCDAISGLSGDWNRAPSSLEFDFASSGIVDRITMPQWIWTNEPVALGPQRSVLRNARGLLNTAVTQLADAQAKADAAMAQGGAALETARVAAEQAAASANAAQAQLKAASAIDLSAAPVAGGVIPGSDRHRVIFRKKFSLGAVPAKAFATILASQSCEVRVNGRDARAIERDGFRNGRIALLDLQPLLIAGENVITIDVSSHTEKQMSEIERQQFPASITHLNRQSGIAFYARCELPGDAGVVEFASDPSWRVRRNPDGDWNELAFADADWAAAQTLPDGATPVDEGPGLDPITRQDFANMPVPLGPALTAAVSTAARAGQVRAAMLAADSLQVALDRPNREIVLPARPILATTMQALALTNGGSLDNRLQRAAGRLLPEVSRDPAGWIEVLYQQSLSRRPNDEERQLASELLGPQPAADGLADLLWAVVNLPEFQLIN